MFFSEEKTEVENSEDLIKKDIVLKHMTNDMENSEPIEKDIRKNEKETYSTINVELKNYIKKKTKDEALKENEKKLRKHIKNRSYFLIIWRIIKKTELNKEFERALPDILEKKLKKLLQKKSLSLGYKKLLCQEFIFMIDSLNHFKKTEDEEESLKIIYYRDKLEVASRTRAAFE